MKKFSKILALTSLLVAMSGCSENTEFSTFKSQQLLLTGEILNITQGTRVSSSGFEQNDKVGVYVSSNGSLANTGNLCDNTSYTYNDGEITAPSGEEIYWETEDMCLSIFAYYPYSETITSTSAYPFSVNTDQSSDDNYYNSDFITAQTTNVAAQTSPVALSFNHCLSKISISLVAGEGITTEELQNAEKNFSINGLKIDGTINLSTGAASVGNTTSTIKPLAIDGSTYSAITYPQNGTITFEMVLDGETYTYSTSVDYSAGYQYNYALTITTWDFPQMTLNNLTINNWEDGGLENGDMSKNDDSDEILNLDSALKAIFISNGYDKNNDAEISTSEAKSIKSLSIYELDSSVLSLSINLPNLESLNITSCRNLYILDISACTALKTFSCELVSLTNIDFSKNTKLTSIYLNETSITSLDVSNNPLLSSLTCNSLTKLYMAQNQTIATLSIPEDASIEYK